MSKVNILGTEYKIETYPYNEDDDHDGYIDTSTKTIYITAFDEKIPDQKENLKEVFNRILRHEIVHAFLYESGLDVSAYWSQNEEMIDWIALQLPKLFKALMEVEAI